MFAPQRQALKIPSYIKYLTRTIPLPPLKSLLGCFPRSSSLRGSSVLEEHQLSVELSLGLQPWAHVGAPGTSGV